MLCERRFGGKDRPALTVSRSHFAKRVGERANGNERANQYRNLHKQRRNRRFRTAA